MVRFGRLAMIAILIAVFYLLFPQKAYAYLDPGTGSFLLQLLIGTLVGFLIVIKSYWGRIRAFFTKNKNNNTPSATEPTPEEPTEEKDA